MPSNVRCHVVRTEPVVCSFRISPKGLYDEHRDGTQLFHFYNIPTPQSYKIASIEKRDTMVTDGLPAFDFRRFGRDFGHKSMEEIDGLSVDRFIVNKKLRAQYKFLVGNLAEMISLQTAAMDVHTPRILPYFSKWMHQYGILFICLLLYFFFPFQSVVVMLVDFM